MRIDVRDYVARWSRSIFAARAGAPWEITSHAPTWIDLAIGGLDAGYAVSEEVAAHRTAVIEQGASVKGPAIIGPRCFVSSSALLRGGVFLDEDCIVGPAVELKTTLMFKASKVAHLSFVGDSIIGADVNLEAGSMVANYRNEMADKRILILVEGAVVDTGVEKFGALIGDGTRIGANAVIAPGAVLAPSTRVPRLGLVDQHPDARPG